MPRRPALGRPRTRGGHPRLSVTVDTGYGSSPHTRGSSRAEELRRDLQGVVPAHAGVIRAPTSPTAGWSGRPRTRGGHPSWASTHTPATTSSPHTRRSSPAVHPRSASRRVVPAHAGVILRWTGHPLPLNGRPRTRGGHPPLGISVERSCASSPHTRGSSGQQAQQCIPDMVVPAHAGVIPSSRSTRRTRRRRPRTRGGHPCVSRVNVGLSVSSPHTRGSCGVCAAPAPRLRVVPAHAGVIRHTSQPAGLPASRPRTRGGHPITEGVTGVNTQSSPHTRGSSLRVRAVSRTQVVVPAHAGVIPLT